MKKIFFLFPFIACVVSAASQEPATPRLFIQGGHGAYVQALSFSPTGKFLISGSQDKQIILWNVGIGKAIKSISCGKGITSLAFSPDGEQALAGLDDGSLILWDIKTEIIKKYTDSRHGIFVKEGSKTTISSMEVTSLAFSPCGGYFLSGSKDATIKIWDFKSGKTLKTLTGHARGVTSACFSPDGRLVASGSHDKSVVIWDVKTGNKVKTLQGHGDIVNSAAFSPDGKHLASGSGDKTVKLWNLETGTEVKNFVGHTLPVKSVFFSPDGGKIISGAGDIRRWDIESGKVVGRPAHRSMWGAVELSPGGTHVAATWGINNSVALIELESGMVVQLFSGNVPNLTSVALSHDGKRVLTVSNFDTITLRETESGRLIQPFGMSMFEGAFSIAFSPDDKKAVSGHLNGRIKLWDTGSGKLLKSYTSDSKRFIDKICLSPDGKYIASGSQYENGGEKLKIWDADSGEILKRLQEPGASVSVSSLEFSPDSEELLAGFSDGTVALFHVKSGKMIRSYGTTNLPSNIVESPRASFSSNGKYLLTMLPKEVVLWDKNGGTGFTLSNKKGPAAFSSDGKNVLVMGGVNGNTLESIEIASIFNENRKTLTIGHFPAEAAKLPYYFFITPDGKYFLSADFPDNKLSLRNIETGTLVHNSIVNYRGTDWLVYNEEDYWDSSTRGGYLVSVVNGMDCWNIDQFAAAYNRPDKIYSRLKDSNQELISQYYSQYLKRLRRLGLNEADLSKDFRLPTTTIEKSKQEGKYLEIHLKFNSVEKVLVSYQVYVNDVPLFGALGKPLHGGEASGKEVVELTEGNNKIEISCLDSGGMESLRSGQIARWTAKDFYASGKTPPKPNLYFLGFGISEYRALNPIEVSAGKMKDYFQKASPAQRAVVTTFYSMGTDGVYRLKPGLSLSEQIDLYAATKMLDLNYAAKDAKDLEKAFKRMSGAVYGKVITKVYTDEQVTRKAIQEAKDFLADSRPDDTFVLFISGHGVQVTRKALPGREAASVGGTAEAAVHSVERTYYYITHETLLSDIPGTAADFEMIEDLLQGIAPRQKIFLMDTCMSGEADDAALPGVSGRAKDLAAREIETQNLRAVSIIPRTAASTTMLRDRFIFNDLVRRSGAIVFSSSRGSEASLESKELRQGVFTHAILRTFREKAADKDKNGFIDIDELRAFVSEAVPKLVEELQVKDGMPEHERISQHPTVDRDNIYIRISFPCVK